jgi:hypothetical protein
VSADVCWKNKLEACQLTCVGETSFGINVSNLQRKMTLSRVSKAKKFSLQTTQQECDVLERLLKVDLRNDSELPEFYRESTGR